MASESRHIPAARKRELVDQAGGKCANPGCSVTILEIHHIKEWHVYKAHEANHMVALCPTCHHHAHHGKLQIPDATLYEWKRISRTRHPTTAQLWVDPATEIRLLTGSVTMAALGNRFSLSSTPEGSMLSFRILHGDVLQVSLILSDASGKSILTMDDNVVRYNGNDEVAFVHRTGKFVLTAPASDAYVPQWVRERVARYEPDFFEDRYIAADIEVVRPGTVRVQGCFPGDGGWIVITATRLILCTEHADPLAVVGEGETTVFHWGGAANQSLFNFVQGMAAGGGRSGG